MTALGAGKSVSPLGVAFGQTLLRLHRRLSGPIDAPDEVAAALQRWSERLWEASIDGHSCLPVASAREREALLASSCVAQAANLDAPGAAHAVLVLDGSDLYTQRMWVAERALAAAFVALDVESPLAAGTRLDAVWSEMPDARSVDVDQRAAIDKILRRRLVVLTGGPGTGKTTTLARALLAALRIRPDLRVAIAAPTGKAASRLAQALGAQLAALEAGDSPAASLPEAGTTVHRLLGLGPHQGRQRKVQLREELIIVDEASMLDLTLARQLVEAIPQSGRLILAGDRDQLASVEAGAIFAEACASPLAAVTRLRTNYRQASSPGLAALAQWIRDAIRAGSADRLGPPPIDDAGGVRLQILHDVSHIADQALAAWRPALDAVTRLDPDHAVTRRDPDHAITRRDPDHAITDSEPDQALAVLREFDRFRILCALRDGPFGSRRLNEAVARRIAIDSGFGASARWYPGRVIMITTNRPDAGLFNGDVGVCLSDRGQRDSVDGLVVAFIGAQGLRRIPVAQVPTHEDAFAMTVHKAQGSEFDEVALVPAPTGHPLNTRELLYTGVTRARRCITVWAGQASLVDGALRATLRHGRLADRIASSGATLS